MRNRLERKWLRPNLKDYPTYSGGTGENHKKPP